MADFSGIYTPVGGSSAATADIKATLATVTSTAEINMGKYTLFAINATGDLNIRFGQTGMPAASNNDFRIPAGTTAVYRTSQVNGFIRLFNAGGTTISYWIQPLQPQL